MTVRSTPLTMSNMQQVTSGESTYCGFSIRETAGSTAVLRIRDGQAGIILDPLTLAANESVGDYYPEGLHVEAGIYVEQVSGTFEGSVRWD